MFLTRNRWRTLTAVAVAALQFSNPASAQGTSSSTSSSSSSSSVAVIATPTPLPHKQSVFVSPNDELAFGISIPDDDTNEDVYFSLATQPSVAWAAVGLGADSMSGSSLVLMIYISGNGKDVTFSPRLTQGRSEPVPYPALDVVRLDGSGFFNNSLAVFRARCRNCRRWPGGGGIDVTSAAQRCIYAAGPGSLQSDDPAVSVRFHASFGAFAIDLRAARGAAEAPVLNGETASDNVGAALVGPQRTGERDWIALVHAVAMIFCVIGVLPLGVVILRVFEWVRWHAVVQGVALVGIIIGFGLGVAVSGRYNRSKGFKSPHQIIGIIFFSFVLAQMVLGVLHHRIHKRDGNGSKLAPVHVWLGRTIILMGVINGFLGFPFALSPGYNYILAGLVLAITPLILFLLFWKRFFRKKLWGKRSSRNNGSTDPGPPPAYGTEQWHQWYQQYQEHQQELQQQQHYAQGPGGDPNYAQQHGQQQPIGLSNLGGNNSSRQKETSVTSVAEGGPRSGVPTLGAQQTPREYV